MACSYANPDLIHVDSVDLAIVHQAHHRYDQLSMSEVRKAVRTSLENIQNLSGRAWKDLGDEDCPIGTLDGFDSYVAIETTAEIEYHLGRKLDIINAFANDNKALTMREVVDLVEEKLKDAGSAI